MKIGLSIQDIADLDLLQLDAFSKQMLLDAKVEELQATPGVTGMSISAALDALTDELYPEDNG